MAIERGEIYFVNLNPVQGREQAGNKSRASQRFLIRHHRCISELY